MRVSYFECDVWDRDLEGESYSKKKVERSRDEMVEKRSMSNADG